MKKYFFSTTMICICIITASFILNSCGKSNSNDDISMYREYLAVKLSNDFTWSIIDKNGQVVVKTDFRTDASSLSNVFDDVYWVKSGGRCQLYSVHQPNQPLLDEEYADVADFIYCGYTFVAVRKQPIRIINTKGETVATLPESIKECRSFDKDGYAIIKDESGKFGIVDTNGKMIIEPTYNTIVAPLGEGVFLAELRYFLDKQGNILGEIDRQKYIVINIGIEGGKFVVRDANHNNPQCYVINTKGEQLFTIKADAIMASNYRDGYAMIQNSYDQWGVVDDRGTVVITPKYSYLLPLGDGEFIAKDYKKSCIINAKNETIIDFINGGFYPVKLGDNFVMEKSYEYILINRQGEQLATFAKIGDSGHPVAYYQR